MVDIKMTTPMSVIENQNNSSFELQRNESMNMWNAEFATDTKKNAQTS